MLAAGVVGILIVAAVAASAFLGSPAVPTDDSGRRILAAGFVGSPLAVPLFVLEGIAGGSAGAWLNVLAGRAR